MRDKVYISTDVEYSWDSWTHTGEGSLLSLWSCVIGDINNSFYTQIQPVSDIYNKQAMRAIAPGFMDLEIDFKNFSSEDVLLELKKKWLSPKEAFGKYAAWLLTQDNKITEIACPIKFDGGLTSTYFRKYYSWENPLWYSWEDGNSMLRGFFRDTNLSFKKLQLRTWELPHNALKDSQIQAVEIELLFKLMSLDVKQISDLQEMYVSHWIPGLSGLIKDDIEWVTDTISMICNNDCGARLNYESIL